MFAISIDSSLRGGDLVALNVSDVLASSEIGLPWSNPRPKPREFWDEVLHACSADEMD
jgi:hypothetical protein